jgi:hypothetical protein
MPPTPDPTSTQTAPASPSPCRPPATQLTQAAGVIADTVIGLVGTIGHHVLANLLPDRRLRVTPRIVKRAISKYQARGPNINRRSYKATSTSTSSPQPNLDSSTPDAYALARGR